MDAFVIAGGIPRPDEPLYPYTRGKPKALIEIDGRPMVQWVLDALGEAQTLERVIVIGLEKESGITCKKPLFFSPGRGDIVDNTLAGLQMVKEINPDARYALAASSDVPAITGKMVDWMINTALETEHDIYFYAIERSIVESRFPDSQRTYVHLKDMQLCGGDMNIIRLMNDRSHERLLKKMAAARKNPFKIASLFGPGMLILLLLRQLTLESARERVSHRLGLRGRVILSPFAEIGMDVDFPHQLDMLRSRLEG
jgi:GTP:adenosylcobinamide-phosphate guanylyltransferase